MDLFFDPDLHLDDTHKSFVDFVKRFELRYDASYPDPPKTSLEAALSRWKVANKKDPSLEEYDAIVASWKSIDMVRKCLGLFSSPRLNSDWELVQPEESSRKEATWSVFVQKLKMHYLPTENLSLKHFQFRTLSQNSDETFPSFCSRVEKAAQHCQFKCISNGCTAEDTAFHDQILFGILDTRIREEALNKSLGLQIFAKKA